MEISEFLFSRIREKGEYSDPKDSFIALGLLDSFDFISLLADIEENFSVRFDLSDYEPDYFTTAFGLIEITEKLMRKA